MDSNMDWLSDFLDESIPIWRDNPVIYFREVLQFEPDEWQAEAAMDLAHNPKVSIKSGQGVGNGSTLMDFLRKRSPLSPS